jgi:hypothetical protein
MSKFNLPEPIHPMYPILQMIHAVHRRPAHAIMFRNEPDKYLKLWFEDREDLYEEFLKLAKQPRRGGPASEEVLRRGIELMFEDLPSGARAHGPAGSALAILDFLKLKYIDSKAPGEETRGNLAEDLFIEITGVLVW